MSDTRQKIKFYTERVWLISAFFVHLGLVLKKKQREIIGEAVFKYREKAKISQEALAEKADIHPNYIGRIERGECSATVETLLKITKSLNMPLYKLFLKL